MSGGSLCRPNRTLVSDDIRDDKDRRITELEALVEGQAIEISRLSDLLDECEQQAVRLALALEKGQHKRPKGMH